MVQRFLPGAARVLITIFLMMMGTYIAMHPEVLAQGVAQSVDALPQYAWFAAKRFCSTLLDEFGKRVFGGWATRSPAPPPPLRVAHNAPERTASYRSLDGLDGPVGRGVDPLRRVRLPLSWVGGLHGSSAPSVQRSGLRSRQLAVQRQRGYGYRLIKAGHDRLSAAGRSAALSSIHARRHHGTQR